MKKFIITIIAAIVILLNPIYSWINYNSDLQMIETEYLCESAIIDMSNYKYKVDRLSKEYICSKDITDKELKQYRDEIRVDSVKGYPNEFTGQRCRVVTYKDGEETHKILVFFKDGKLDYWQFRTCELDFLIKL